jgi:hypothetical protein
MIKKLRQFGFWWKEDESTATPVWDLIVVYSQAQNQEVTLVSSITQQSSTQPFAATLLKQHAS